MNGYVSIGGSEALSLKGALPCTKASGEALWRGTKCARRPMEAPYLGEAQALTTDFVRGLAQGLGSRVPPEILPENVLVRTAEVLVWWSPAKHRTMFFTQHDPDLKELNGKRFPHPPLVWKVSGRDLWVRALAESKRPSAATKLMTAPYWNVAGDEGCSMLRFNL